MSTTIKNKIKNSIVFTLGILAILALAMAITVAAFTPKEAKAYYSESPTEGYQLYYGEANQNNQFVNKVPSIYSINPSVVNTNTNRTIIIVTGYNFTSNSIVKLNDNSLVTNYLDSTHLSARIEANDVSGTNNNYISVWNPDNGGGFSNTLFLAINTINDNSLGNYFGNNAVSTNTNNTATNTAKTSTNTNDTTSKTTTTVTNTNDNNTVSDTTSNLASNALYGSNGFMPSGLIQWLFIAIFILLAMIAWRSISGREEYNERPMKHA